MAHYSLNTTKLQTAIIESVTNTNLDIGCSATEIVNIGNTDNKVYINGKLYGQEKTLKLSTPVVGTFTNKLNFNSVTNITDNNFIGVSSNTMTEFSTQVIIDKDCDVSNLYILSNDPVTDILTINVRRNGENTNLFCVILPDQKIGRNINESFNCLVGDLISLQVHSSNNICLNCSLNLNYNI